MNVKERIGVRNGDVELMSNGRLPTGEVPPSQASKAREKRSAGRRLFRPTTPQLTRL